MMDWNVNAFNNLWIIKVCYTALTFSAFGNFDWVAILSMFFLTALLLSETGRLARFQKYIHPEARDIGFSFNVPETVLGILHTFSHTVLATSFMR